MKGVFEIRGNPHDGATTFTLRPRVLPCDRVRYAATVAALLAVYALLWGLDVVSRLRGRGPVVDREGRYPWES